MWCGVGVGWVWGRMRDGVGWGERETHKIESVTLCSYMYSVVATPPAKDSTSQLLEQKCFGCQFTTQDAKSQPNPHSH